MGYRVGLMEVPLALTLNYVGSNSGHAIFYSHINYIININIILIGVQGSSNGSTLGINFKLALRAFFSLKYTVSQSKA